MRTTTVAVAVAVMLACLVPVIPVSAQGDTTGKVTLETKSIAVGVGVSWGEGTLEYRGKKYKFSVDGLSVADLGVSKVTAKGEVKNLKKLEDFAGNYVTAAVGAVAGGGAGVAALKNQNGVEMALSATAKGIEFKLATAGVEIKLKK
jgi:hypothetical protein